MSTYNAWIRTFTAAHGIGFVKPDANSDFRLRISSVQASFIDWDLSALCADSSIFKKLAGLFCMRRFMFKCYQQITRCLPPTINGFLERNNFDIDACRKLPLRRRYHCSLLSNCAN